MNPLRYRAFRFLYAFDRWRTRRFTPTGTAFTASLILTGILQADSTGSLIYQVFTFTGAIVGLSTLYSFRFREKFRLRRTLPRFGTVGVPLQYRITIENGTDRWQRSLKLMENFADPRPSYRELRNTPEPGEHRRNRLDQSLGYYRWLWLIRRNLRATTATVTVPPIPPRSSVEVTEHDTELRQISGGATVADLLTNLKALGLKPSQLVNVFVALDKGGFLHADLEVR